ncbi:MAG: hypothetical protein ACMXYF_04200 [Candidatus Woesearchaeota archaeon]
MRKLLLVFGVLLFLPSVFATLLHSDTIYSHQTLEVSGRNIEVVLGSGSARITIDFEDTRLYQYGSCRDHGIFEICIGAYEPDSCSVDSKYNCRVNPQTLGGFSAASIQVHSRLPQLEITREATTTNPIVGDEFRITTELRNTGQRTLESLEYIDAYPQGLQLKRVIDASREQNSVLFRANRLQPGETRRFIAVFEAQDDVRATLVADGEYTFSGEKITFRSSSLTIEALQPVTVTALLNGSTLLEHNRYNFTYILKNNLDVPAHVGDFKTTLPLEFRNVEGNTTWKGTIPAGDTEYFSFLFQAPAGKYPVSHELTLTNSQYTKPIFGENVLDIREMKAEEIKEIQYFKTELRPRSNPTIGGLEQAIWVNFFAIEDKDVHNMDVKIHSDIFENQTFFLDYLRKEQAKTVGSFLYMPDQVESKVTIPIIINATYEVIVDGQRRTKEFNDEYELEILSFEEALEIRHVIDDSQVRGNAQVRGVITAENKLQDLPLSNIEIQTLLPTDVISAERSIFSRIATLDQTYIVGGVTKQTAHAFNFIQPRDEKERFLLTNVWIEEAYMQVNLTMPIASPLEEAPKVTVRHPSYFFGNPANVQVELTSEDFLIFENVRIEYIPGTGFDPLDETKFEFERIEPGDTVTWRLSVRPRQFGDNIDFGQFVVIHDLPSTGEGNIVDLINVSKPSVTYRLTNIPILFATKYLDFDQNDSALVHVQLQNNVTVPIEGVIEFPGEEQIQEVEFEVLPNQVINYSLRIPRGLALDTQTDPILIRYTNGTTLAFLDPTLEERLRQPVKNISSTEDETSQEAESRESSSSASAVQLTDPGAENVNLWVYLIGVIIIFMFVFVFLSVRQMK